MWSYNPATTSIAFGHNHKYVLARSKSLEIETYVKPGLPPVPKRTRLDRQKPFIHMASRGNHFLEVKLEAGRKSPHIMHITCTLASLA